MATENTPKKDKEAAIKADKEAETAAMENAPQADLTYKPDANTVTDNRRSDYDQPNLVNPDSQAIHRDIFEDGGEGDKAENHEGDKAWDASVKEDDVANRKEAEKNAPKVVVVPPTTHKK